MKAMLSALALALALAGTLGCAARASAGASVSGAASASVSGAASASASEGASAAPAGWSAERSGTTATLDDVGCLTATHCIAVGDAGTLLATTDGGRSWHRQASPVRAPLSQVVCVAPASCYVIARPGSVLVTHDAGAHWAVHALSVHVPGLTQPGCVIGDGSSPRQVPCPLGLLDISCATALRCYAVATAPAAYDAEPAAGRPPGSSVWLTRNGGATWTSQPIPAGVVCDGDCSQPYGYPLEWVSCAPSGPCWAGGNQLVGSHEGFAAALLMTPAAGQAWRLVPGCPPGRPCTEPVTDLGACPASTGCFAVNNSNPFGDGSSTVSRFTASGQPGPTVTVPSGLVITGIACPAARVCYTAGTGGVILHTTNGRTFTRVSTPARANLNGITCVTPSACYAVGDRGTIEAVRLS
jgi:hypothetical protein